MKFWGLRNVEDKQQSESEGRPSVREEFVIGIIQHDVQFGQCGV